MEVNRHLIPWMEGSKGDVCRLQDDPLLWSEDMIAKTYRRTGVKIFNLQDTQTFIKDYLSVLCESRANEGV